MEHPPSDDDDVRNRLAAIPKELLVRVIHADDSICVIVKPANLRSVPGHANPPPHSSSETQNDNVATAITSPTRNAQACWIKAVKSFDQVIKITSKSSSDDFETTVMESLARLANSKTVNSVPRKWKSFLRHVNRYQKQIVPSDVNYHHHHNTTLENLAQLMFQNIEERYRPLLQLPEPTRDEESALGQLILMGYGKKAAGSCGPPTLSNAPQEQQLLYAVHRLDCETSGVMVFARNEGAASFLSQAWRQGDHVSKVYWAKVRDWPPYQQDQQLQGCIDLPLVASTKERLKWQVQTQGGGKPSTTLWKVLHVNTSKTVVPTTANGQQLSYLQQHVVEESSVDQDNSSSSSYHDILLELTPLTGRTHQLRIHCAHVGSGIVGDSLYGADRVEWSDGGNNQLCLHAYQLCFPHPDTGEPLEFTSPPTWIGSSEHEGSTIE